MMETSKRVHPEYAERLNLADEIWVPCTWNRDVFKSSDVLPPIKVMPLGVDTELFKPGAEPMKFKARGFRFISVFGWSYRKGFDVMLQAYLEEFNSGDDVSLVMSTRFVGQVSKKAHDRILSDFAYVKSLVGKPESKMPHVALHSAYTPDIDMPRLYAAGHCFVLPSRGEGMGLPFCEAGACGLPVIASDHGGQRDFLDDSNSYLVQPDGYFTSNREDPPFRNMAWISHFYEGQQFPHYGRPAIDQLRAHMRHVCENHAEAQEKAERLRQKLIKQFDWKVCVAGVYERLKRICKEL
jgi:glycosyltransferase involved in cell wall biosynthesis